ncbi:4-carboxymuconolactone decarboxylase [Moniliophthora roreri]|uniref:Carboxymuconolactone decarboxylase-like domain-containing protein n=1 Tax=Moniliophthora roreri TaxID=221103 RepID=A0A0W0GC16_MONRR|nr:4-carboxymuconolactone decarboxylase [Moniliophthora roreri]
MSLTLTPSYFSTNVHLFPVLMSSRPNEQAHKEIYDAGMVVRRRVLGDEFVDNQLAKGASEFMRPMQEVAWGSIWTRPGLESKQRSLITIALLAFQAKHAELAGHIRIPVPISRGAVANGATETEIRETLLHTSVYCGIPTGMESFRVAEEAVKKLKAEGLLK